MSNNDTWTPPPEGTPSYLQIPAHDVHRAIKFYGAVFPDWEINDTNAGIGHARISFPGRGDRSIGGIVRMRWADPSKSLHGGVEHGYAVEYFFTYDMEAACAAVDKAGGKVLLNRESLGEGMGWISDFRDTEGNFFGLYTSKAAK